MGNVKFFVLIIVSILMTACGQGGFERTLSLDDIDKYETQPLPDDDFKVSDIETEIDAAQSAMLEAEAELEKMDTISLVSGTVVSEKGLDDALERVLNKAVGAVAKVDLKLKDVRAKIEEKLLNLDPSNVLHLPLIIKSQEILSRLDDFDGRLNELIQRLAEKLDSFVQRIEKKIAAMDPKSPLTWAAMIYWQKLKKVIIDARARLVAI